MKKVTGDLIAMAKAGEFDLIVQGCNCFNTMGKGIAAQIRTEFPKAYQADQATKRGDPNKFGKISYAEDSGVIVVNAYTQFDYWSIGQQKTCFADYDAIESCFKEIKERWGGTSLRIGIPLIGAGLAGGDWNKILPRIEKQMEGEDITLVIFNQ